MDVKSTKFDGLMIIVPSRFSDDRGWFSETWNLNALRSIGMDVNFVQDNHSYSLKKGTLRGLHYQCPPYAQDKLVRCSHGAILDVVVDVRKWSPTFGKWERFQLSAENGVQLLVPKGFLHGFLTLTDNTEVQYKCSEYYKPEFDGAVKWNSLDIDWGLDGMPLLSAKDSEARNFAEWTSPFIKEYSE